MSHQNITLHLYFSRHSKLNIHFLNQNHVFSQKKKKCFWVADKEKDAYLMKYTFTECESG